MRTLSSTLLDAQRSASQIPYLKVETSDRLPQVARPIFTKLYSGSASDFFHDATMPGDGSLIRARIEQATQNLYVQRVVSPEPSSDFSSWSLLNTASPEANVSLASRGSQVLLFFVESFDRVTLKYRESTNYGATWSAIKVVVTPAATKVLWLAADINNSGVIALFYVTDDQKVHYTKRTGSLWSNPLTWPITEVTTILGIDCTYQGDWDLVVCGQRTTGEYKVWTIVYGDGGPQPADTWSGLQELTLAEQDSDVQFHKPFLGVPDTFRMFFVEKYTGSSPYTRALWSHALPSATFLQNRWREPVPFNWSPEYGIALAYGGGYLWLSTPSAVWRGSTSPTPFELTEDVLEAEFDEESGGGKATLVLRNDDGRYNTPGTGSISSLRRGSQVRLSPGYHTSTGLEMSQGPTLWVRGWEHHSLAGRSLFLLHLEDGWALLDAWKARRQYEWATGQDSVQEILTFILSRVVLELSVLSSSTTFTSHLPRYPQRVCKQSGGVPSL